MVIDSLRQAKVRTIQDFLVKYTEPKPSLDGITAHSIAERLVVSLEELEMDEESLWMAREEVSEEEAKMIARFNI